MTTVPARPTRLTAAAPTAVAALSLLATAAMWTDYPLVPPLIWLALLLAVAVSCAASARRARGRRSPLRPHLALEPFAMALMVVIGMLHGHGSEAATAAGATTSAASPTDATAAAHAAHLGWLTALITLAMAALAVACPVLAIRHAPGGRRARRPPRHRVRRYGGHGGADAAPRLTRPGRRPGLSARRRTPPRRRNSCPRFPRFRSHRPAGPAPGSGPGTRTA